MKTIPLNGRLRNSRRGAMAMAWFSSGTLLEDGRNPGEQEALCETHVFGYAGQGKGLVKFNLLLNLVDIWV